MSAATQELEEKKTDVQTTEQLNKEVAKELTKAEEAADNALAEATPEELEAQRQQFMHKMGYGPAPKEEPVKEEKKEDKEAKADDKTEEVKPDDDKEPEKKKAKKPKQDTNAAIKAAVKEGVTEAVRALPAPETKTEKVEPAKPEPDAELSDEDKATITVLSELERINPATKGIVDKTRKFWEKETSYVAQWETDHPGEEFNQGAEEHKAWYAKNEPSFTPHDFEKAKESLLESRIASKLEKKHSEDISRVRLEHQYERALPQIMATASGAVADFVALAHPDFEALITVNGRRTLTPEIIAKLDEADKEATDVLEEMGEQLRLEITELETISRFASNYKLDPNRKFQLRSNGKNVYVHRDLQDFAENLENELAKVPAEETSRNGQQFVTQSEFLSKVRHIETTTPKEQRAAAIQNLERQFWTLDANAIRSSLIADRAEKAQSMIARMDQRATRAKASNGKPDEKQEKEKVEETPAKTARIKPPSTASASDKVNTAQTGKVEGEISLEEFEKKMWGR